MSCMFALLQGQFDTRQDSCDSRIFLPASSSSSSWTWCVALRKTFRFSQSIYAPNSSLQSRGDETKQPPPLADRRPSHTVLHLRRRMWHHSALSMTDDDVIQQQRWPCHGTNGIWRRGGPSLDVLEEALAGQKVNSILQDSRTKSLALNHFAECPRGPKFAKLLSADRSRLCLI